MNENQRKAIRTLYWKGLTEHQIAVLANVDLAEVDAYLGWWCDRGCPPGGHGPMPECSSEGQED